MAAYNPIVYIDFPIVQHFFFFFFFFFFDLTYAVTRAYKPTSWNVGIYFGSHIITDITAGPHITYMPRSAPKTAQQKKWTKDTNIQSVQAML